MKLPDRKTVERVSKEFPAGTRVELVLMDDLHAPPSGTLGTVIGVDDNASLLMEWDNGSCLNVIYGKDSVRKIVQKSAELATSEKRKDRLT